MQPGPQNAPRAQASAAVNAVLALLATIVTVAVALGPQTGIDHQSTMRPWGCRSCPIPQPVQSTAQTVQAPDQGF